MSCLASSRSLGSSVLLALVCASVSMSVHFDEEARPGAASHFFWRASRSSGSGMSWRR